MSKSTRHSLNSNPFQLLSVVKPVPVYQRRRRAPLHASELRNHQYSTPTILVEVETPEVPQTPSEYIKKTSLHEAEAIFNELMDQQQAHELQMKPRTPKPMHMTQQQQQQRTPARPMIKKSNPNALLSPNSQRQQQRQTYYELTHLNPIQRTTWDQVQVPYGGSIALPSHDEASIQSQQYIRPKCITIIKERAKSARVERKQYALFKKQATSFLSKWYATEEAETHAQICVDAYHHDSLQQQALYDAKYPHKRPLLDPEDVFIDENGNEYQLEDKQILSAFESSISQHETTPDLHLDLRATYNPLYQIDAAMATTEKLMNEVANLDFSDPDAIKQMLMQFLQSSLCAQQTVHNLINEVELLKAQPRSASSSAAATPTASAAPSGGPSSLRPPGAPARPAFLAGIGGAGLQLKKADLNANANAKPLPGLGAKGKSTGPGAGLDFSQMANIQLRSSREPLPERQQPNAEINNSFIKPQLRPVNPNAALNTSTTGPLNATTPSVEANGPPRFPTLNTLDRVKQQASNAQQYALSSQQVSTGLSSLRPVNNPGNSWSQQQQHSREPEETEFQRGLRLHREKAVLNSRNSLQRVQQIEQQNEFALRQGYLLNKSIATRDQQISNALFSGNKTDAPSPRILRTFVSPRQFRNLQPTLRSELKSPNPLRLKQQAEDARRLEEEMLHAQQEEIRLQQEANRLRQIEIKREQAKQTHSWANIVQRDQLHEHVVQHFTPTLKGGFVHEAVMDVQLTYQQNQLKQPAAFPAFGGKKSKKSKKGAQFGSVLKKSRALKRLSLAEFQANLSTNHISPVNRSSSNCDLDLTNASTTCLVYHDATNAEPVAQLNAQQLPASSPIIYEELFEDDVIVAQSREDCDDQAGQLETNIIPPTPLCKTQPNLNITPALSQSPPSIQNEVEPFSLDISITESALHADLMNISAEGDAHFIVSQIDANTTEILEAQLNIAITSADQITKPTSCNTETTSHVKQSTEQSPQTIFDVSPLEDQLEEECTEDEGDHIDHPHDITDTNTTELTQLPILPQSTVAPAPVTPLLKINPYSTPSQSHRLYSPASRVAPITHNARLTTTNPTPTLRQHEHLRTTVTTNNENLITMPYRNIHCTTLFNPLPNVSKHTTPVPHQQSSLPGKKAFRPVQ